MSTTKKQAASSLSTTTRGAEPVGRPAAPVATVGALVSRRSGSGFGTEPRSF